MSAEWWASDCNKSSTRPLPDQLAQNYGGYIFAIITYTAAAFYSAYWMYLYIRLWRKESKRVQDLVWSKLPHFLFIVFWASATGCITRATWMLAAEWRYKSEENLISQQRKLEMLVEQGKVFIGYRIFRALETPFLSVTYLIILDRLTKHAVRLLVLDRSSGKIGNASRGMDKVKSRLRRLNIVIIVLVSLSSSLGVVASMASAHYLSAQVAFLQQAVAACGPAGESTNESKAMKLKADAANENASLAFFIQSISDVVCIGLISFMYFVIGPVCLSILGRVRKLLQTARDRIVDLASGGAPRQRENLSKSRKTSNAPERSSHSAVLDRAITSALDHRKRYKLSYITSLVAFIIRSLFVIFIAMTTFQQASTKDCRPCDGNCQQLGALIGSWYLYNTWFSGTAFAITTPVAFSVGVWCMMNPTERLLLQTGELPDVELNVALEESVFSEGHDESSWGGQ